MTDFKDNQLKNFLQRHQPKSPTAPKDELGQILKQVEPKPSIRFNWFVIPTAIAAGLMAFWISMQPATEVSPPPVPSITEQQPEELNQVALIDDEDVDLFDDEKPTLEIGEDYLTLAGL